MSVNEKKQKPSILLVEDTPSQAMIFQSHLQEQGCNVQWENNGPDGLQAALDNAAFDLILLDVELPGMDGFEICHRLKENTAVSHIPVIMLTTRDAAADAMTGLENGAIDYIPKDPFAKLVLVETLKQMGLLTADS